jgi:Sulfotransferase family
MAQDALAHNDLDLPGPALDEPVIILTGARSGSTLLRILLDAHPELACPSETNIAKVCLQLGRSWSVLDPASGNNLSSRAVAVTRGLLDAMYGDYLRRNGKRRWCDKSLGTAQVAAILVELFPKAKFVCLYRHCMDVIDSGLEASPWGLIDYGFQTVPGPLPGNNIAAIAAYWIEHTAAALNFEARFPDKCHRVYYEDLALAPEETADDLLEFIGVAPAPGIASRCFDLRSDLIGFADHKLRATSNISADSVGRGIRIPPEMMPPGQLDMMNKLLVTLGYTPVDEKWLASPTPLPLLPGNDDGPEGEETGADTTERMNLLDKLIRSRFQPSAGHRRFAIVAYSRRKASHASRAWAIDPAATAEIPAAPGSDCASIDADWLLSGELNTWLAVMSGELNAATAIHTGSLRHVSRSGTPRLITAESRVSLGDGARLSGVQVLAEFLRAFNLSRETEQSASAGRPGPHPDPQDQPAL